VLEMTPQRIRFLRKRLGLSQAQLGRLMNVHQTLISHWEKGARFPDKYQEEQLRHLYRSAQELGEEQQMKVEKMIGEGLFAGAMALLIGVGIAWLLDDDSKKKRHRS